MLSIRSDIEQVEARHFIDDEHQITIGIRTGLWPIIQEIANAKAKEKGWLGGNGSNCDHQNIWIIGRVRSCPHDLEPWEWVEKAVTEYLGATFDDLMDRLEDESCQ